MIEENGLNDRVEEHKDIPDFEKEGGVEPNFGNIAQILPYGGIEDEEDRLDLDELQREITELREKRLSTNQP
jgi:hypothetical protein